MNLKSPLFLRLSDRLDVYIRLMRADKPIGTLLLLWPTYWALWLASDGIPDWTVLAAFTIGTFLMRSAGCVINDFADRDFDGGCPSAPKTVRSHRVGSEKKKHCC